jgi:Domain of unknown function (DUF4124)
MRWSWGQWLEGDRLRDGVVVKFLFKVFMTRQSLSIYCALIAAACMPWAAHAAINKCVGADGKVVFSDQACSTGQAATQIQAPAKPAPQSSKPIPTADLPLEGAATPNSYLQQYDTLCAEDRRLLAIEAGRVKDTIGNQNFQATKANSGARS